MGLPIPGIEPGSPSLQADSLPTKLFYLLQLLSRVQLFATSWTVAHQALSMGCSRQEYWSGLPFPLPKMFVAMSAMGLNKVSFTMSPTSTTKIEYPFRDKSAVVKTGIQHYMLWNQASLVHPGLR